MTEPLPENTFVIEVALSASASVACEHGQTEPHDDCPGPGVEPPSKE